LRFYLKGGDREETKVRIRGKPRAKAKQRFKKGRSKGFRRGPNKPCIFAKGSKNWLRSQPPKRVLKKRTHTYKTKDEFRIMSRHENSLAVDAVGVAR